MPLGTQRTLLDLAHLWAGFTSKVLGALAILVAAWWTYTNFTVERTHDPTMEVSVEPSIHPLEGEKMLLNVDVFMRNIGKVAIVPRFPVNDGDEGLGLEISIVEIEPLGRDPPGVRYREPFACVVDRDKLYAIRARFWTDEGSVADLVYVDTYRPSQP